VRFSEVFSLSSSPLSNCLLILYRRLSICAGRDIELLADGRIVQKTGGGPCSTHDPDRDFVDRCPEASARGADCENPMPTSQGSSTHRGMNCPKHRNRLKPPPGKNDEGSGGAGSGTGVTGTASQTWIKVGA
jgi:hypothetical protein